MIEPLIRELNLYRNNPQEWLQLAWQAAEDGQGEYVDLHKQKRDRILLALQFDLKPTDEPLLKFLLQQEILDRENDPFQGVTEDLCRGAYLLATFKNPENVWLFTAAKAANFDTSCGFDYQYLLSAGIEETFTYVQNTEHPLKENFHCFFDTLENCPLSPEDMEKWIKGRRKEFPAQIDASDLEAWMDLGLKLSQKEKVYELLQTWTNKQVWNYETLQTLKYYQSRLDEVAGEIETLQKLIGLNVTTERDDDGKAWDYYELAQLQVKDHQLKKAWNTILSCTTKLPSISEGRLGQLRDLTLEIIGNATGEEDWLPEAYQFALEKEPPFFTHLFLQKVVKACQVMKDGESEKYFESLLQAELKRLDDMMNNFRKDE